MSRKYHSDIPPSHPLEKAYRDDGLTLAELVRRSGVDRQSIYRYATGASIPRLDHALAIETVLCRPCRDLFPQAVRPMPS